MGHGPREKPKKGIQPERLCNKVIIPLLTTTSSPISSHQ